MYLKSLLKIQTNPHKSFLYIAILWGTMMIFILPPFMVPDEPAHFFRSYQISEGKFFGKVEGNKLGAHLPVSLLKLHNEVFQDRDSFLMDKGFIKRLMSVKLNRDDRAFLFFPNTSLYSPIPYIPQALGINMGKNFNAPPLILLYLGRLFNLFFWILIVYFAIKQIPIYKWLFVVLALLPMSINQASSTSADVILNALSFLIIALTLNWSLDDKKIMGIPELLIIIAISILLTLSKSIYFVLAGLFLIIPISNYKSKKQFYIYGIYISVITLITFLINYSIVKHLISQIQPIEDIYGGAQSIAPKINPDKQLQLILDDKWGFMKLIWRSFWWYKYMTTQSFIGIFGWMNVVLYKYYYILAYFSIGILAIVESNPMYQLKRGIKIFMIFLFISVIILFSITMYLSWNNVGDLMVDNLQGRYFIPIVPLILMIFYNNRFENIQKYIPFYSIAFVFLSSLHTIQVLLNEYYF